MNKFLSVPKNAQINYRLGQSASQQFKPSETSIMKDTFNASHYLKTQQSKQNKWLGNLHQKPLLQIMTDSIQIKQFTPVNSTELNCYQRLKKLLTMQSGKKFQDKPPQQNIDMLNNVVILQNQISKLQQKYRQNQIRKNKLNKTIKSAMGSKKNSFFEKTSPPNSSLNTTQKSVFLNQNYKLKKMAQSPENQHQQIKQTIKEEITTLKNTCIQKFVAHKKKLNQQIFEQVYQFINNTLQKKVEDIINCKMKDTYLAQQENKKWKLILLQKDLEIQSLKKELRNKEEKIVNNQKLQEPQQQMINYRKNAQYFYEEYESIFGSIKLPELKKKIDFLENMYITKYASEQSKQLQRLNKAEQEKRQIVKKMSQKIHEYEVRENQMRDIISRRRKYEQLDNSQETHQIYNKINWYKAKSEELQQLQKFVFNKYTQWINNKNDAQNKIIQQLNNNKLQDYTQMIEAILDFQKGFGDQHKNIQFISKMCNMVAKIKKIMTPNSVYKKLEPLKTLQEVQTYLLNLKRKQKKTKTINRTKQYINDQQI